MSKYLRDEFLRNIDITETSLTGLNGLMADIVARANIGLQANDTRLLRIKYVIRFDKKGFTLTDFDKLLSYYKTARRVERIIIQVDCPAGADRSAHKAIDLALWGDDPNKCILTVQDDDSEWTDSIFLRVKEELDRHTSRLRTVLRTAWIYFLLQLSATLTVFMLSFLAALKTSIYFAPPYILGLLLVLYLIIFSTIWTYLYPRLLVLFNHLCPNIKFKELSELEWIVRLVVGAGILGVLGLAANEAFNFAAAAIRPLLK